ncbi:hypothetical protein ATJ88_0384 [Isoptericola jiangsuensis]|uniref:Uncharacterized protein n=1 Tax=Isoptericola jiangsuensis TaxID=548579 RepID=A0A2A9ETZ8_9MICO|nr:hypothetical protein [Isoptericola jiangsuensis]PFG41742.1 hypothetical protein ATJ88_0384 [Isoptericola jiangsuensis]
MNSGPESRTVLQRLGDGGTVVVPHLEREDGTPQVRVFDAAPGSARPYELRLFTSPQALEAHLGDDPGRAYSLRRRDSLAPFLRRHGAVLERVVVDAGGPDAVQYLVTEVLAALDGEAPDGGTADGTAGGRTTDDPTGFRDDSGAGISIEGLHAMASVEEPGGSRGIGIELNLPDHWTLVELTDPVARTQQIRALVTRQGAALGDRGARLRRDLRERLTAVAEQAAGAGGQVMAFLTLPGERAALAVHLTLFWHDLGPQTAGRTHLDRIDDRLRPRLGPDDALTRTETLSGPFLRHVRLGRGDAETGGGDLPLLLVDYWAATPGGQAVARLAFSTPHVEIRDAILALTDRVLFATEWLMSAPEHDAVADVVG